MPPAGLTLLAATTRPAAQVLFSSMFCLPLVAGSVIEFIRFNGAFQLTMHLIGQGSVAKPPAPTIAGAHMHTQLPGDATGRTREAQQKGGQNPIRERPLALGEERLRQVVKGTPAVFAAVAFEARSVMISTPGTNLLAVAMGTLQGAIFPPQRMDIGVASVGMEELV
jgi:hypothetical protein